MNFQAQSFTKQINLKDQIIMLKVLQLDNFIMNIHPKEDKEEPNTLKQVKSSDQKAYRNNWLEIEP